ncbi:MAG: transposase, partial [Cyanobacteria bacterium J06614_10]
MSYRILNWSEYSAGLKQREGLTFWSDEAAIAAWEVKAKRGRLGASATYSDVVIATFETPQSSLPPSGE